MDQDDGTPIDNIPEDIEQGRARSKTRDNYRDEEHYQKPTVSYTDRIVYEAKLPLFVAILVFILCLQPLDNLIIQYVPKLASGSSLSLIGIAIKALVAGIIFYIANAYIFVN
jgi:hypothetical protein